MNYHKIETLYVRDEKTKQLVIGKFRSAAVEFLKDNQWQFTEKIHGTNVRVIWDGHTVSFGDRAGKGKLPDFLTEKLNALFGGEVNAQIFEQRFGENPAILFGEGYGGRIQTGKLYRKDADFILFDVAYRELYQTRESVEEIAEYFNIDVVPIVLTGTIQDGVDYVLRHRQSTVAQNGHELEGVVGRPMIEMRERNGKRIIVKIKHEDFNDEK